MKQFKITKQVFYNICMLAGLVMGTLFLTNIGSRYINIGSITGAVVFSLLFWYGVNPEWFQIQWQKLKKKSETLAFLMKGLSILILILAFITSGCIISGLFTTVPTDERTVIILGSGVNHDGTPTTITRTRLDAVLPYIREHPNVMIITSGGLYSPDLTKEADSMKQYLMDQGVSEEQILAENKSTSTAENLRYSSEVIRNHNLSTKVIIATSEFHAYRSALYGTRNHLDVVSVNGKTPWWVLPTCWVREMYGVLDAWIIHRGYHACMINLNSAKNHDNLL